MKVLQYIKMLDKQGYPISMDMDLDRLLDDSFILKASISIDGKGTRTLVGYEESKDAVCNKFDEMFYNLLDSFNISVSDLRKKVVKAISDKKDNAIEMPTEEEVIEEQIELTDEDMKRWNRKTMQVFRDEIERLTRNKKSLGINNNDELSYYIKDFSDGRLERANQIVPENIKAFNTYLEDIVKKNNNLEEKTL